jgi:putative redox protein
LALLIGNGDIKARSFIIFLNITLIELTSGLTLTVIFHSSLIPLVMTDKSKELHTNLKLINNKLHFIGSVDGNDPVSIDYTPPLGDNLGYTSLELFLLSLSSCMGSAILTFLRRMNKTISNCEIQARGIRKEEHPTGFRHIHVSISISSTDITGEDMNEVIALAEDKYCPVWSMIRGNTYVETSFDIIRP